MPRTDWLDPFPGSSDWHESFPASQSAPAVSVANAHCSACGRSPVELVRFVSVESYVLFFRWHKHQGCWCRDCAINAFRVAQHRCLTRGWWGLLLGPLANLWALLLNLSAWRHVRDMPSPDEPTRVPVASPIWRRPAAYLTTVAAAVIATLAISVGYLQPGSASQAPDLQALAAALDPTPIASSAAPPYVGPLARLAPAALHGWVTPPNQALSLRSLSHDYANPKAARSDLRQLGFRDGLQVETYRPSPRVVVDEQILRFGSGDNANGWLLRYLLANQPSAHTLYGSSFPITHDRLEQGFLCKARDDHGFSYGVAIAQVNNLLVEVRVAELATVTRKHLSKYLVRARNSATAMAAAVG